jgi:hypothetical protein
VKRLLPAAIAVAVLLAMAACTFYPKGVDGSLTNHWARLSTPRQIVPHAGSCYSSNNADMQAVPAVPCTASHLVEFFKVGSFTGSVAAASSPPKVGSTPYLDAYGQCDSAATAFLGKDWHEGLLLVDVEVPDLDGWQGGARWYACAVTATSDLIGADQQFWTGSLQHVLSTSGKLSVTCVDWTNHGNDFVGAHVASCSKPHSGELAGVYTVPMTTYPTTKQWHTLGNLGCEPIVAKFLGFTDGIDHNASVGYSWTYVTKQQWDAGNRTTRCFASAFTHDHKMTGSVRGIGSRTPKGL